MFNFLGIDPLQLPLKFQKVAVFLIMSLKIFGEQKILIEEKGVYFDIVLLTLAEPLLRHFRQPKVGGVVHGLVGIEPRVEAGVVPVGHRDHKLPGPLDVP